MSRPTPDGRRRATYRPLPGKSPSRIPARVVVPLWVIAVSMAIVGLVGLWLGVTRAVTW